MLMIGYCAGCDDRRGWRRDSGLWVCRQCGTHRHTPPPEQAGDAWLKDLSADESAVDPAGVEGWCADCRDRRDWRQDDRGRWVCGQCRRRRYAPPGAGPPLLGRVERLPVDGPAPGDPLNRSPGPPAVVDDDEPRREIRMEDAAADRSGCGSG